MLPKVEQLHTIIYIDTEPADHPTEAQRKTAKDAGQAMAQLAYCCFEIACGLGQSCVGGRLAAFSVDY